MRLESIKKEDDRDLNQTRTKISTHTTIRQLNYRKIEVLHPYITKFERRIVENDVGSSRPYSTEIKENKVYNKTTEGIKEKRMGFE